MSLIVSWEQNRCKKHTQKVTQHSLYSWISLHALFHSTMIEHGQYLNGILPGTWLSLLSFYLPLLWPWPNSPPARDNRRRHWFWAQMNFYHCNGCICFVPTWPPQCDLVTVLNHFVQPLTILLWPCTEIETSLWPCTDCNHDLVLAVITSLTLPTLFWPCTDLD